MKNMQEKHLTATPIYYWVGGSETAESILFLHSAFSNHHCFDKQVSHFIENYRVFTTDLLGHGKSIKGQGGGGIEKTSQYIHQLLVENHIDKIHLVGVSIGSVLAQDFANQHPDSIASLCCVGGYDINNFDTIIQKENNSAQAGMILKSLFSIKWFAKSNRKISAYTENAQEEYYQMNLGFKKSSLRYFSGLSKLINKQKTKPRNYPLMIGCGKHDVPNALKASEQWNNSEPQSHLVIFENAGHHVNMDTPGVFNSALDEHLSHAI